MNDQFSELVNYIKRHAQQGISVEHIRTTLLQHNWQPEVVDRAIWTALAPQSAPEAIAAPFPEPQPVQSPQVSVQPQATPPAQQPQQAAPTISERPPKYTLRQAFKDFFAAARSNLRVFLLATITSGFIAITTTTLLTAAAFLLPWQNGSLVLIVIKAIILLLGVSVWWTIMTAFMMASTSLPLYDNGQRHTSLKGVLLTAFKRAKRILIANLFMLAVAIWPIVAIIVVPLVYYSSSSSDGGMIMLALIPILSILGAVWMVVAFVLFALVPYVAIFEPKMPIRQVLRRSQHLLSLGGHWFVVKGIVVTLVLYIIIAGLSGESLSDSSGSSNMIGNGFATALSVIANGVMVMFYRNRKTVRG